MTTLNINTPEVRLPFDPPPAHIAPGKTDGRKRHFGQGPCNEPGCGCNGFVGTLNICERSSCGHSWNDHS